MDDEYLNRKSADEGKGQEGKYLKYNLGLGLRKGKGNQWEREKGERGR
jgi:hypothetical protein